MNTLIKERDAEKAAIVSKIHRITGVSKRQVYRVIAGDQANNLVMSTYMLFQEGNERLMEKAQTLHREVKKYA